MQIINILQSVLAIVQGVLNHFVSGEATSAVLSSDYEWSLSGVSSFTLETKGQYLVGAVADIVTYGAVLVDWVIQSLMFNGSYQVNAMQ